MRPVPVTLPVRPFPGLFVAFDESTGRGVYARDPIPDATTVDRCPSWELTPHDLELFGGLTIRGHWFVHPDKAGWGLLGLGICGLVNHSARPNVDLVWARQADIGYVGELRTVRSVAAGEELRLDYGIEPRPGWAA